MSVMRAVRFVMSVMRVLYGIFYGIGWQKFWHITLPSLSPVILFNVVIGIIQVFQYFVPAYVMTSGGPKNATLFYSLYIYQKAFEDFEMGYASALAWVLFLIITGFTYLAFRILPNNDN